MTRITLIVLAAGAILCGLLPGATHAQSTSPTASAAAESLARCVQTAGNLQVIALIDASKSLESSDRNNERASGIQAALDGLTRVAAVGPDGARATVDVLPLTFASDVVPTPSSVDPARSWRKLTTSSAPSIRKELAKLAEPLRAGTDYATALIAVRALFAQRSEYLASQQRPAPCRALVWFTDGQYQLEQRGTTSAPTTVPYAPGVDLTADGGREEAVKAGKEHLCRPNGLMDGLVTDGVIRFTVLLAAKDGRTSITPDAAAFLEALTLGKGPDGQECGRTLTPRSGEFLRVASAGDLFVDFGQLVGPPGVKERGILCPTRPCQRGSRQFRVVEGISRFRIRASTGADGIDIYLAPPGGGEPVLIKAGDNTAREVAGAAVSPTWASGRNVEIVGELPADRTSWIGSWALIFVDPSGERRAAVPLSSLLLETGVRPELARTPVIVRGKPTTMDVRLVGARSLAPTSELLRSAELAVSLLPDPSAKRTSIAVPPPVAPGRYAVPVTVPETEGSPTVIVDLVAQFADVDGIPVAPARRSVRLPSRLPDAGGYPSVSPQQSDLGSIEGAGTRTVVLRIAGSRDADGCVWFGKPRVEAPSGAGPVRVDIAPPATSRQKCIAAPSGKTRDVRVTVTAARGALGGLNIDLPVRVTSDLRPRSVFDAEVSLRGRLLPASDTGKRIALVVLGLLGTLIPFVALHLFNLAGAKFTAPQRMRWAAFDVAIDKSGNVTGMDGAPLDLDGTTFELVASSGAPEPRRDLAVDGFNFHAVATGNIEDRRIQLFSGPYGTVEAAGAPVLAGGEESIRLVSLRDHRRHTVPLALPGTWVFARTDEGPDTDEDTGPRATGRLALIVRDGAARASAAQLLPLACAGLASVDWDEVPPAGTASETEADTPSGPPESQTPDDLWGGVTTTSSSPSHDLWGSSETTVAQPPADTNPTRRPTPTSDTDTPSQQPEDPPANGDW